MTNSESQSIFGNCPALAPMKKLNRPTKLSQLLRAAAVLLVCAGFGTPSLRAATGESEIKIKPGTVVKLFSPTGYDMADSE